MKLSNLIGHLKDILAAHGDHEVEIETENDEQPIERVYSFEAYRTNIRYTFISSTEEEE